MRSILLFYEYDAAPVNCFILGDNLETLKGVDGETVDLIYLDSPLFINRNYEVIWGDAGEVRSFQDRWAGGIDHYIAWLKERIGHVYRVLKPTGSIFLHCDWHADAYIRVHILYKMFSAENVRGNIAWQGTNAHSDAKKKIAILVDTIWCYARSKNYTYNPVCANLNEKCVPDSYRYNDKDEKVHIFWVT